jgi:hypothetical protein
MKIIVKVLLILTISLSAITLNAQVFAPRFGLRGGVLFTDWAGEKKIDENINYSGKTGGFVGLYFVSELSRNWLSI